MQINKTTLKHRWWNEQRWQPEIWAKTATKNALQSKKLHTLKFDVPWTSARTKRHIQHYFRRETELSAKRYKNSNAPKQQQLETPTELIQNTWPVKYQITTPLDSRRTVFVVVVRSPWHTLHFAAICSTYWRGEEKKFSFCYSLLRSGWKWKTLEFKKLQACSISIVWAHGKSKFWRSNYFEMFCQANRIPPHKNHDSCRTRGSIKFLTQLLASSSHSLLQNHLQPKLLTIVEHFWIRTYTIMQILWAWI